MIFQGIRISIAKKPYIFVIFRGGGGGPELLPPTPCGSAHEHLDACLTADPGVASSIPARYHTFVEIDHEIISTVILHPSADLLKKGCCQLQAKVCAQITG